MCILDMILCDLGILMLNEGHMHMVDYILYINGNTKMLTQLEL